MPAGAMARESATAKTVLKFDSIFRFEAVSGRHLLSALAFRCHQ